MTVTRTRPRYTLRRVPMRCDCCGRTALRSNRGGCKMCGEGMFQHVNEEGTLKVYETKQEESHVPTDE